MASDSTFSIHMPSPQASDHKYKFTLNSNGYYRNFCQKNSCPNTDVSDTTDIQGGHQRWSVKSNDDVESEIRYEVVKDNPHGQEHLDEVHNENVLPRLLTVNERDALETDNFLPSLSGFSSSSSVS